MGLAQRGRDQRQIRERRPHAGHHAPEAIHVEWLKSLAPPSSFEAERGGKVLLITEQYVHVRARARGSLSRALA
jgi:hypothetical protein